MLLLLQKCVRVLKMEITMEKEISVRKTIYSVVFKRIFDFSFALIASILLCPIMFIIAILVRCKLGSPILFRQQRPGFQEKVFELVKFRTMTDKRGADGNLLPDEERLTRFGKWLRATSLDELPELWNILKGDMSIVGPRPLLVQYLSLYNERQKHRHDVKPGITGYAQVHGRNGISWEEKFEYDLWYVEHISLILDAKILFATIKTVLKKEGISSQTSATMEYFTGSKQEE